MSTRLFRSAFSQEDNQPNVPKVIDPMKAELALESAAVEISESGFEVQMAEFQQEELEHAHASLESIANSLESLLAADERGLDRVSAEGYQHAVTAILGDSLPNPVASLESFGGESECAEATQMSMEGIKDTLQKIWQGIKRSIENAIRATSDFFAKLFGGVKKLQDRIASMKQQVAEKQKADAKAGDKFKVPGANAVQLGGDVSQKVLEDGASMVMSQVSGTADALQEAAVDYYKGLVDFYSKKPDDAEALEGEHKKAADKIEKIKISTGELPGGKMFEVESKTKGDMETVGVPKLVDFPSKKNVNDSVELEPFDLKWIEKMLDTAGKFTEEMSKKQKRREDLKSARQDTMKAAEQFVGDSEKKLSDKWNQAKLNWAMKSANKDFSSTIARVDGYVFSYVRALLAVLGAAVSAYGAASTEEASQEGMKKDDEYSKEEDDSSDDESGKDDADEKDGDDEESEESKKNGKKK